MLHKNVTHHQNRDDVAVLRESHDMTEMSNIVQISIPCIIVILLLVLFIWMRVKLFDLKAKHIRNDYSLSDDDVNDYGETRLSAELSINEVLGNGTFSVVYKGLYNGKNVAVKIMDASKPRHWQNEKTILQSQGEHENIVKFFKSDTLTFERDQVLLLILEFADQGDLRTYLRNFNIDVKTSLRLMTSLSNAVFYLHSDKNAYGERKARVIHQDIKSTNVLFSTRNGCVLADFGLAMQLSNEETLCNSQEELKMTKTLLVGTPRYMAPEKLSRTLDSLHLTDTLFRLDIYAMGLVFYEVASRCEFTDFAGNIHYPGDYKLPYIDIVGCNPSVEEMRVVVVEENIRPLCSRHWKNNEVFMEIQMLIEQCWQSQANERPSALDVHKQMNSLLSRVSAVRRSTTVLML